MNASSNTRSLSPSRVAVLGTLLGVLFLVAGSNSNAPPRDDAARSSGRGGPAAPATLPEIAAQPEAEDARYRGLAVGTWQDEYKGKRTMHLLADGTGTMIVELSGLTATLFAGRLEFDMVWSIEGGRMQKRTLGGRPEGKVKAILSMMGDRVDEPILELSEERLLLLDADGKTRYDWRRVREEPH